MFAERSWLYSLNTYCRYEFQNFDYVQNYVPNDLLKRGFPNSTAGLGDEKYKNYAYAKNMLSMWNVIRTYVKKMLLLHYNKDTADRAIQQEQVIKDWYNEIQIKGWIKTFPTINTLDELCDALTMSIHIAAPFHSAVNYLLNFYQAFVPAKPASLCDPMPKSFDDLKGFTEKRLLDALPVGRQRQWLLSVPIPGLLTFKVASDRSLLTFAQSQWRAKKSATDPRDTQIRDITLEFFLDLQKLRVQYTMTSRAMDEGSIPYMVLDPNNTAVSILI